MEKTQISFLMEIEEVDYNKKKGIYVKGKILSGTVQLGDHLEIRDNDVNIIARSIIASIQRIENESGSKLLVSIAETGDTVKLWLTNSQKDNIRVGQTISTPKKSCIF